MWRDPDITPLVEDFVTAYSYLGLCKPFDTWLGEYSTATRVWLSRASPGYLTRLRAGIERVRPLLHDRPGVRQDFLHTLGELDTEGQRVGRTDTVAEALVGVLSCVTRMSAAVTKLVTLTRAVNLELSQALPEPKLVPFVPMAPVRPGFMTLERGVTALTPAMKRRLRVHVNWSATKNLTDEQVDRYERDHGDITKLRRVLSVKTDGVSAAVKVWVGREKYRGGRVADRPTYKKGSSNKRARLGQDDAEATPAPDIQALMGFDPGARSLGGYTIRRPDGHSVSGVLAKCGYTATPSFRVNMSAASFKTTSLEALKQSIRFVHENIVQIINEGTRNTSPGLDVNSWMISAGAPGAHSSRSRVWGCTVRFRRHSLLCTVPPLCSSTSWHNAPAQRRRECHDGLGIPHFHRNPACEGAPWRVERLRRHPEQRDILLNLSHRDKSASENILWCTFDATSDQIEQSPFHYDSQRGALPRYH
ncbi:hypothetical protein J8273_7334 [Carpediemonas membranifera]|uniref:Uncharacterized protein n=1 Tax=Carpediemonas membranifera TaxID=201153 RepID=A0A8J6E7T5_9EUKA|nr:hypothetical protein J8273_7334 [Carpediemonas membranifera]|eukprot:KAG9391060.1 hypothetical protein J8273_7334 [Carpediemonas membranifera]